MSVAEGNFMTPRRAGTHPGDRGGVEALLLAAMTIKTGAQSPALKLSPNSSGAEQDDEGKGELAGN